MFDALDIGLTVALVFALVFLTRRFAVAMREEDRL